MAKEGERERERGGREREEKIKMDRGHKCCAGFQYDRVAHLGGQGLFSIKKREGTIAHLPFYTISTGIVLCPHSYVLWDGLIVMCLNWQRVNSSGNSH